MGDDMMGTGTASQPFKTILRALEFFTDPGEGLANRGGIINLQPGVFNTDGDRNLFVFPRLTPLVIRAVEGNGSVEIDGLDAGLFIEQEGGTLILEDLVMRHFRWRSVNTFQGAIITVGDSLAFPRT